MGRRATGIDFTTSAPKLELSALLRAGYFTKGATCSGGWSWSNGDRAEVVTAWNGTTAYIDIRTHYTDHTGKPSEARQRINLHRKPSNLGRGEVPYFVCPRTGKLCRVLYRAYSSPTWRSRNGFIYRLYYPQQAESGWARHPIRESSVERKLERLYAMRTSTTYKGKPTRRAIRIAKLERKLEALRVEGWDPDNFPPLLRDALNRGLLE